MNAPMMDYKAVLAQMDDMKRAPWFVCKTNVEWHEA